MRHRRKRDRTNTPVIIGTGLVALDVVIADNPKVNPFLCAGGTCGNVLTALAYFGWDAYPIARLRSDAASKRIIDDLSEWGVKLDFITLSECGSTPVVVQHILQRGNGKRSHRFSRRCPTCGAWLPWYKAVRANTVPELTPRLPKADVFYFDRTSRGAITLAENARKDGALVVFEPSTESDPEQLADALETSHVVKVASDRAGGNESFRESAAPLLLIETLGPDGLRYSYGHRKRRAWTTLPAFETSDIRDTAGAGDWCTAGIIEVLGPRGPKGLEASNEEVLHAALRRGQAMAAWNCHYDGARGGMYASGKGAFEQAIKDILAGKARPHRKSSSRRLSVAAEAAWCNCCIAGA